MTPLRIAVHAIAEQLDGLDSFTSWRETCIAASVCVRHNFCREVEMLVEDFVHENLLDTNSDEVARYLRRMYPNSTMLCISFIIDDEEIRRHLQVYRRVVWELSRQWIVSMAVRDYVLLEIYPADLLRAENRGRLVLDQELSCEDVLDCHRIGAFWEVVGLSSVAWGGMVVNLRALEQVPDGFLRGFATVLNPLDTVLVSENFGDELRHLGPGPRLHMFVDDAPSFILSSEHARRVDALTVKMFQTWNAAPWFDGLCVDVLTVDTEDTLSNFDDENLENRDAVLWLWSAVSEAICAGLVRRVLRPGAKLRLLIHDWLLRRCPWMSTAYADLLLRLRPYAVQLGLRLSAQTDDFAAFQQIAVSLDVTLARCGDI